MPRNFAASELTGAQKGLSDWVMEEPCRTEQRLVLGQPQLAMDCVRHGLSTGLHLEMEGRHR